MVPTTALAKDSKVSKLPVQKTNPCVSSRIAKSPTLSASDSKHITQPGILSRIFEFRIKFGVRSFVSSKLSIVSIACLFLLCFVHTAVNAQKKSGLKGSSNNTRNVVNNLKAGTAGKSLTSKTTLGEAKRTVVRISSFFLTPSSLLSLVCPLFFFLGAGALKSG